MRVRHPEFDFDAVPLHWAAGDPVLTHLLNAFHVIIPDGEQFFIRTVRETEAQLRAARSRALSRAFIGQEAWHQRAHRGFWDRLRAQGLAVDRFERLFRRVAVELLEQRLGKRLSLQSRLAITAALEHYTAVLSGVFFDPEFPIDEFPPVMNRLHRWHGAEELEHKAVAFDLLQELGSTYPVRAIGFLTASTLVAGFAVIGFTMFASSDRSFFNGLRRTPRVGGSLLRPRRLARTAAALVSYLRPGFHPNDLADPQAAGAFLAEFDRAIAQAS